ncbi:hypothetical protein LOAG_06035 [Loa loa]|uniref:Copper transport protein n=1 Tax=Loa loa TaxID=7209 RepID=A0A1S0TZI5_LOALO|nr:hypothetical protein LOAG_06035 [Loa loa]EFO22452.1 hypothetical protein LOAG_06035 [Loa loa]
MWSWFHFTVNDILLFQSWKIDTTWRMIISCIGIFLLGIFFEGIKLIRRNFNSTKSSLTTTDQTTIVFLNSTIWRYCEHYLATFNYEFYLAIYADYLSSNTSNNLICDTTYHQLPAYANIYVLFGLV